MKKIEKSIMVCIAFCGLLGGLIFRVNFWKNDLNMAFFRNVYYPLWTGNLDLVMDYRILEDDSEKKKTFLSIVDSGREYDKLNMESVFWLDLVYDDRNKGILEDEKYYYFLNHWEHQFTSPKQPWYWIEKKALKDFHLIGYMGVQTIYSLIGYVPWFLIVPPYKFAVDQESFDYYLQQFEGSNPELEGENWLLYLRSDGRTYCYNGGMQYAMCVWSDKNWVYRWSYGENGKYYFLREEKKSDFRLLDPKELVWLTTQDLWLKLTFLGTVNLENKQSIRDSTDSFIGIYHDRDFAYLVLPFYWVWRFSIDWDTIDYEEKTIKLVTNEYPRDYALLSDKDWYYQVVYYADNGFYELRRSKK